MILQIKAKNQVLQKKKAGKTRLFLFIILPFLVGRGLSLIRQNLRFCHLPLWEGFFICRGGYLLAGFYLPKRGGIFYHGGSKPPPYIKLP